MSRVTQPSVSTGNMRSKYRAPTTSPTKPTLSGTSARLRVPSTPGAKPRPGSPSKPPANRYLEAEEEPSKPKLSLKEQIALRRAEIKKAPSAPRSVEIELLEEGPDAIPVSTKKSNNEVVELGRWGIRETVERARSSGNLNISSRSLPCIPSCLFEVHLGVTPKPLESVTEPEYPEDDGPKKSRQNRQQPSWFEAQDLTILKARNNEITAIQPELSLFGSLKIVDFHSNQLKTLPVSLTILSSLTSLDVSSNALAEFPPAMFSLPALTSLNLSNNQLTSLSFARFNDPVVLPDSLKSDSFYQPHIERAVEPLPNLHVLDVGHNKLIAAAIDTSHLPRAITRIILTHNPLGRSRELITALAKLQNLQEVVMDRALIKDDSLSEPPPAGFSKLQLLDLSETEVTEEAVRSFFANSPRIGSLSFHVSTAPPSPGELRVSVGKRVIKESWEIETEQRYLRKKKSAINVGANKERAHVEKEPWELEAEQGLTTEGGRRKARAAAAVTGSSTSNPSTRSVTQSKTDQRSPKPVEKEQWEIEAEQGLLTEGGRRRLRAQQAALSGKAAGDPPRVPTPSNNVFSLANSTYYSSQTLTLTLPPSVAPSRSHARAFSMATTARNNGPVEDLHVPSSALPLEVIVKQEFAPKLQVLNLSSRRADPTFSFPTAASLSAALTQGSVLPRLSELNLDGCSLNDDVSVSYETDDGGVSVVQKRNLLEVIAETFPSLTILDLSYNNLTSDGLSPTILERVLVPSVGRKGLKILRLRGNRLTSLDTFELVAGLFRGNRQVDGWCLEELDVRDNEVAKLPPLLGLIPMDVFLVDGNVFRVPPRKVWEREGTKGLLSWLRGRIE